MTRKYKKDDKVYCSTYCCGYNDRNFIIGSNIPYQIKIKSIQIKLDNMKDEQAITTIIMIKTNNIK